MFLNYVRYKKTAPQLYKTCISTVGTFYEIKKQNYQIYLSKIHIVDFLKELSVLVSIITNFKFSHFLLFRKIIKIAISLR